MDHAKLPMGIGTPEYMAPEVLRGGPCTPSSDTFSFGVTLFHILTGEGPYWSSEEPVDARSLRTRVAERGERPRSGRGPLPAAVTDTVARP